MFAGINTAVCFLSAALCEKSRERFCSRWPGTVPDHEDVFSDHLLSRGRSAVFHVGVSELDADTSSHTRGWMSECSAVPSGVRCCLQGAACWKRWSQARPPLVAGEQGGLLLAVPGWRALPQPPAALGQQSHRWPVAGEAAGGSLPSCLPAARGQQGHAVRRAARPAREASRVLLAWLVPSTIKALRVSGAKEN